MKQFIKIPVFVVAILLAVVCSEAQAQNTVTVLGTFVKAGKTPPPEAVEEAKIFGDIAKRYPVKEKVWKWVIIADDAMWHQMMVKMGFEPNPNAEYYGQTDIDRNVTYIRGWTLLHPDRFGPDGSPEHVIAHEMAHVYLHSRDEKLVDDTAKKWMAKAVFEQATSTVSSR